MWVVVKRELQNYWKNPIVWAGAVIVIAFMGRHLSSYLGLHYFQSEEELPDLSLVEAIEQLGEADVTNGYIPSTREQQMAEVYERIRKTLLEEYGFSKEQAEAVVRELEEKDFSALELDAYMEENYSFYNAYWMVEEASLHRGSVEEVNEYIRKQWEKHPYSFYFSRKFADFCGLFLGFFSTILLAFLYIRDTKKDIYELLHTKPVSAAAYVGGKAVGGFFLMLSVLAVLNVIFMAACAGVGRKNGFPVNIWDLPAASCLYIVPNLLMITCIYTAISLLFKTPYPGVPFIILYQLYSNMGSVLDGKYGYYGRPLAIMVRFPGEFFDTAPPPLVLWNQLFLILASVGLICFSVWLFKKRRNF